MQSSTAFTPRYKRLCLLCASASDALYNGEMPVEVLLEKADKRLYEAKKAGKEN